MNENVEKVVEQIIELVNHRIEKLKKEITKVCESEVEQ